MITLITEPEDYSPKAIRVYRGLGPVYLLPGMMGKKKADVLRSANILVVRLANHIDGGWLGKMPNLKIIATNTTGLNHIDVDYATKKGVKIISLRGRTGFLKNIPSTAELTIGLMIALVRNIPWAFESVKKGEWDRNSFRGYQFIGKTFGILGYGRLGKLVGRYAKAFGMKVIAYDPYVSSDAIGRRGVEAVNKRELFKKSDLLSVHVLLTDKTRNLITSNDLKLMKPTSYLINTARAEIIKKDALYKALKEKWIAGVAIDVMWNESADGSHLKKDPLWRYAKTGRNLILVPHIGGAAYDAMQITEEFIADLVKEYVLKKKLK